MKEKLQKIADEAIEYLKSVTDTQKLNDLKVKYLGKKSELSNVLKDMANLTKEERPVIGALANKVRKEIEEKINEKEKELAEIELAEKLEKEKIDITLPSTKIKTGSKHPVNRVIEEIEDLFVSMGYTVETGPELETDRFCFELLNLPQGHPARDMQDSFYITDEYLLRTQTSAVQARTMLANEEKSPIRMICPGKTYRRADLKGTLEIFAKKIIGENSKLRFRPSYFPFTEPSYEVDVSCFKCGGKGCNICKQTGWIEVLGSGMVHPNVLKMCGYDPEKYSGFAFGLGLERIAMFKYGIPDMRYLYQNDVRFLEQFSR